MANLNKIILVGNVAQDPESKVTTEGIALTTFKMAVSSYPTTEKAVIDVIAWQKLAEVCGQYLKNGRLVLIEGRLQVRTYEGRDGQKKWVTEIVASKMQMLDGKPTAKPENVPVAASDVTGLEEVEELPEDDLPF